MEQVKRDKQEIKNLQDSIKLQKEENEKKLAEIEENQKKISLLSGPIAKEYRDNLAKNKFLTDYIANFDSTKAEHVKEYTQMQRIVVTILEKISKVRFLAFSYLFFAINSLICSFFYLWIY